jgi:branched-subunit amino acid ABC-type transport system permease component
MPKQELASAITEYSHTITSKIIAVAGGTSAISHTPAGSWLKGIIDNTFSFFQGWPWMEFLSYIAIILLIIERGFIVWAWNNKRKRGEL